MDTPHRSLRGLVIAAALSIFAFGTASAITIPEIIDMLDAGVGETIILRQLEEDQTPLRISNRDLIDLKNAGASDRLLEALLDWQDDFDAYREGTAVSQPESGWNSAFDDWNRPYNDAGVSISVSYDYDPFGYHWYASPVYYAYYYPFRSFDIGFYYAGWHNWRWWGWHGYWNSVWWDRCSTWYPHYTYYTHYNPHHSGGHYSGHYTGDRYKKGGRDSWSRGRDARGTRENLDRGRTRDRTYTQPDRSKSGARPSAPDSRSWGRDRSRDSRDRGGRTRTYTPPRSDPRPSVKPPSRPSKAGGSSRGTTSKSGSRGGSRGSGQSGWRR